LTKIISYWTRPPVFNGDTPISTYFHSDFLSSSEVVTMRQTDGAAHKLKPRSFHKSTHLWVYFADFHPGVNRAWQQDTYSMDVESGITLDEYIHMCCNLVAEMDQTESTNSTINCSDYVINIRLLAQWLSTDSSSRGIELRIVQCLRHFVLGPATSSIDYLP